jgi:pimeloyl-ACP methyl ester carboxylesterase
MPIVGIDGIATRYEEFGAGPPLLMYAPGGFDATVEKWSTLGIYARLKLLDHLPKRFRCILFDRRETGQSGGRVEAVGWRHFVEQGRGLLDHLGITRAHLMGGCMGCSPLTAFAVASPERVSRLVLFWPVGGPKYRIANQARFAEHLGFVEQHGLAAVVALAQTEGKPFGADPRGGPWASVIYRDPAFAADLAKLDVDRYKRIVAEMARNLFDRDTAPGAEPEDLMRSEIPALIVPGRDASHPTSAARYLEECLPRSDYLDLPVAEQTEATVPPRILDFLSRA